MRRKLIFSVLCFMVCLTSTWAGDDTKLTKTIKRGYLLETGNVEISNKYGQIVINTWNEDSVKIEVKITSYGKSDEDAQKIMDRVEIDFTKVGTFLTIETVLDRKSGFFKELWNNINDYSKTLLSKNKLEIDYNIYLPESLNLELENKFGDIYIQHFKGKCDIVLSHGNLRANSLLGASKIDMGFGDIKIKEMKSGSISLRGAEAEFSNLGKVKISSSSSDIVIKNVDELDLVSRGDKRVIIEQINSITGKGLFSNIQIDELNKGLDLEMNFGDLEVKNILFDFTKIYVDSKSADIDISFDSKAYFKLDVEGKEESISLPKSNARLDTEYIDDKEKSVRITGTVGLKNNYQGIVSIKSSGGSLVIDYTNHMSKN